MIIISTSLTVPGQPSPWFRVEAWLPFRNCEMDYWFFMCYLIEQGGSASCILVHFVILDTSVQQEKFLIFRNIDVCKVPLVTKVLQKANIFCFKQQLLYIFCDFGHKIEVRVFFHQIEIH